MIYDDACPMCKGYTHAFKRLGWSERTAFSKLSPELMDKLDLDRARHEIPLLDLDTGTVKYGLDSQVAVLAKGLPFFGPVLRNPALKVVLTPLYGLITYNRRVIAGTKPPASGYDCAPDFHLPWRLAYLTLAGLAIGGLATLSPLLLGLLGFALVTGLLFTDKRFDLLGNFFTIALLASLLGILLPEVLVAVVIGIETYRRFS